MEAHQIHASRQERNYLLMLGVMRTINELVKEKKIKW
jgi:hypothetical protein